MHESHTDETGHGQEAPQEIDPMLPWGVVAGLLVFAAFVAAYLWR